MGHLTGVQELLEFSFESTVAPEVPAAALLRLARRSAAFNARMALTGRLDYAQGRFVQTLEGPADVVLPLAGLILADTRHRAIEVDRLRRRCRSALPGLAGQRVRAFSAGGRGGGPGLPAAAGGSSAGGSALVCPRPRCPRPAFGASRRLTINPRRRHWAP